MKHPILAILFLLLTCSLSVQAQESITAADKQTAVDSLAKGLTENYIYPEKADEMADAIRKNLRKGVYDGITTGPAFAERLTKDLQDISHDKHLRVNYAPGRIAERMAAEQGGEEDEAAFLERELARSKANNFQMKELKILPGNVGYFKFNGFADWDEGLKKGMLAMQFLSDVDAIIFDLRENGGGSPRMVQVLSTYLFEDVEHLNTFYWRPADEYNHFYTLPAIEGDRMPDIPVYVLTSRNTFSAAEEFTYNLKNMERATIVGETTGGGAHPGGTRALSDKFIVFMPMGKAINPITKTNWEGTGIEPHIAIASAEALEAAHLDALDKIKKQKEGDKEAQGRLSWIMAELNAQLKPVSVEETVLRSYVGSYGPRTISWEDGILYYQREGNPRYELLALSEDSFKPIGTDGFHIQMERKDGAVIAIIGQYEGGGTDRSERTH